MEKVFIKDKQGNNVLPITHVSAVKDDNGNDIGSVMGAFEDEVRGLVDTPHENFVTVAATSSTTAATDVLPNSGQSADTIYRVSNWDGSANSGAGAYDVTKYSEYAWDDVSDPNKYIFLCTKSAIGEVFDITAYNNNTKYTDLAAALGTNGANIPDALRKGGMSVKFVLSSDNKYVQYMYIGTSTAVADFTNVNNWEKINLKKRVTQLEQSLDVDNEVLKLTGNFDLSGATVGFYKSNGTVDTTDVTYRSWNCKEFDATQYRNRILFTHIGTQRQPTLNCYVKLADNSIVSLNNYVLSSYNISGVKAIKVPTNANSLLLSWAVEVPIYINPPAFVFCDTCLDSLVFNAFGYKYDIYKNGILGASVPNASEFTTTAENLSLTYTTSQGWISTGGVVYDSPAIFYKTDFINISQLGDARSVIISGKGHPSIAHISFWNSLQQFISGVGSGNPEGQDFSREVAVPESALYFRLSGYPNDQIIVKKAVISLPSLPDASIVPYNAYGDSITDGVGATSGLGSYAARLNKNFSFSVFHNYGLSATSFCKQNNSYEIIYSRTHQLSGFSGLITLAGGTNDYGNNHSPLGTLESIINKTFDQLIEPSTTYVEGYTFAEAFRYTLEDLKRNNPNAKILVLLPINRANENTSNGYGTMQDYRNMMIQICQSLGIEYVDMTKCGIPIYNSSTYFRLVNDAPDGLHPNDFGYYLMTSFLIPRIEGCIKEINYMQGVIN